MSLQEITNICFMDNLLNDFGQFDKSKFTNNQNPSKRLMGDSLGNIVKYKDPDAISKKLYEATNLLFYKLNGVEVGKIEKYGGTLQFFLSGNQRYSCDYIGPSATQAAKLGVSSEIVGNAIKECRTIGGHLFWPRHIGNVNTARAIVCDRIDIALLEIKNFYDSEYSEHFFHSLKIRKALKRDEMWFRNFVSFPGFTKAFILKNSFVDNNYNVNLLSAINPKNAFIPDTSNAYIEFMNANIEAVKNRNIEISKLELKIDFP